MNSQPQITPRDPGFESRVRASFARQRFMETLDVTCTRVVPGEVGEVLVALMQATMMSIRDREGMSD